MVSVPPYSLMAASLKMTPVVGTSFQNHERSEESLIAQVQLLDQLEIMSS